MTIAAFGIASLVVDDHTGEAGSHGGAAGFEAARVDAGLRVDLQCGCAGVGGHVDRVGRGDGERNGE